MRCKSIFIVVFAVFFIGLASASFYFSEQGSLIINKYQPSQDLETDLNISFLNQPLNSTFTDSLGNYIVLQNVLQENPNYYYIFYDISNTSISSAYQTLSFNWSEFSMPSTEGTFSYKFNLSSQQIFEQVFEVVSSGSAIQQALQEKKLLLNASKHEIGAYDSYTQNLLNQFLNISIIESELEYIEDNYASLTTLEQEELLVNISLIKLPTDLTQISYTTPMMFYPQRDKINLDILAEIGGGFFSGNYEEYLDSVYLWNNNNLITQIVFKEIQLEYESTEKDNLRIFVFSFERIGDPSGAYIVLQNLGDIIFEDLALPIQEYNEYLYVGLNEVYGSLAFSTTQDVNFIDVPFFVSPSTDNLEPVSIGEYERWEAQKKWLLFGLILFLLLFIGAVTYILLQIWYRKRYETYLFKTKNNMYNIMIYIHNSKLKGMSVEEIEKNLKKAGWAREQISYAMRKYHGKKIAGMVHPPMNIGSQEPKKEIKKNPVKK